MKVVDSVQQLAQFTVISMHNEARESVRTLEEEYERKSSREDHILESPMFTEET